MTERNEGKERRPAIFIQLHKRNSHLRKGFPSLSCHVNPRLAAIFNACFRYARSLKGVFLYRARDAGRISFPLEDLAISLGRWIVERIPSQIPFHPRIPAWEFHRGKFEDLRVRDVVTQDDLKSKVVDRKDLKVLNLEGLEKAKEKTI